MPANAASIDFRDLEAQVQSGIVTCALVLLAALAAPVAAGPLEDGVDAYRAKEYAKAAELWRPLADKGDAVAQYRLGTLYMEGKGVEQNDATAFMWLQRAANQGNAEAQYDVGASYMAGLGVDKNEAEGARWFERAANQGMPYAQLNLGLLYASGTGVPQDNVEALKWLDLALFALPAGGARSDVSRAIVDVAAKMDYVQKQEATARERAWKAKPETK
jgi:TPR repeat protein